MTETASHVTKEGISTERTTKMQLSTPHFKMHSVIKMFTNLAAGCSKTAPAVYGRPLRSHKWKKGTRKEQNWFCSLKAKDLGWGEEQTTCWSLLPELLSCPVWHRDLILETGTGLCFPGRMARAPGFSLCHPNYNILQGRRRF